MGPLLRTRVSVTHTEMSPYRPHSQQVGFKLDSEKVGPGMSTGHTRCGPGTWVPKGFFCGLAAGDQSDVLWVRTLTQGLKSPGFSNTTH